MLTGILTKNINRPVNMLMGVEAVNRPLPKHQQSDVNNLVNCINRQVATANSVNNRTDKRKTPFIEVRDPSGTPPKKGINRYQCRYRYENLLDTDIDTDTDTIIFFN